MFFGPSFKLFRVAGFPVSAHWSLFIALGLMAWSFGSWSGLVMAVLLFGSILLHELGHSLVARRRRIAIEGIELHLFGGVAKMTAPPRSPKDEIAIAIAGPLVSLALAGAFLGGAFALGPAAPTWLGWIGGVNLLLGVFNLLPALPMDGGRVFRAMLARRQGLSKGTRTAVKVSKLLAVVLAVLGFAYNPWLIALAVLLWSMGSAELRQVRAHEALKRHGYGADFDPWARYDRAANRERGPEILPPEPEILRPQPQAVPADTTRPVRYVQRFVRDPFGRWVVVNEAVYRW
jgi:Zn-dependent protease